MRTSNKSVVYMGNVLPSEYQQVEYLESHGTEYIQLNYGFYKTDEVDFKFSEVYKEQTGDKYMVSPSSWNTNNNRFAMGRHRENYVIGYGSVGTGNTGMHPGTRYLDNLPHTWHYKDYLFSVEDPALSNDVSSIIFGSETTNLKLFYGYNSNTKGAIYYWRHKKVIDGVLTLVEDLVPARRKSDSVLGMYDLVTNTFFTNQGTGTFACGADVYHSVSSRKSIVPCKVLPDGYKRLEYIQSNGTQWIDTGVVCTYSMDFDIVLKIPQIYSTYDMKILGTSRSIGLGVINSYWRVLNYNYRLTTVPITSEKTRIWTDNDKWYFNDVLYNIGSRVQTSTSNNIHLFAIQGDNGRLYGSIYSCKIKDGGELKCNFIPSQRLSDNAVGMYDLVSNTFFENQGTGSFIAGPEVSNYDYISSNKQIIYENSN